MKTCMTAAVFLFLQLFFSSYATFELSAEAPQKKGKNMSQKSLLINAARFLLTQWEIRDGNSKEIFAEIISAEAAHPGSMKAIKEYFPRTYQVYQDMMKARKKR